MKEITIRLADSIAVFISEESKEIGLTSEELIKCIVGYYAQRETRSRQPKLLLELPSAVDIFGGSLHGVLKEMNKDMLKARAREGSLSCKNCTMKLTEIDIEAGECSSCHAPIFDKKDEGGIR